MTNKFGKKFAIVVAVALVKGRIKNGLNSMPDEEIELLLRENPFLEAAPFTWIALIYRYGIKNNLQVDFQRINKKDGDLPIALELDMNILKWADQHNLDLLKDIFMVAALEALLQVCDKYKLPKEAIVAERAKYRNIPNIIEECEKYETITN
jgi:hypothetical protein